jgi:hypothetical protein
MGGSSQVLSAAMDGWVICLYVSLSVSGSF